MKKLKTLGIISAVFLVLIISVFAVLAALGIFKIETDETGKSEIIFTPAENKNSALKWQTEKTEGDITAVFKTDLGKFEVKLGDFEAAEKFIELDNEGTFDGMEFSVLAENMFIQTSLSEKEFSAKKTELAAIKGAACFVMNGELATASLAFITADEISRASADYMEKAGFDEERKEVYNSFGGKPEYEENLLVFGSVVSGFEVIKAIESTENSGYVGGYSPLEPVKIISVEINFPTEEN